LPISEIMHDRGVELAGVFPMEIQFIQTFSAAVVAGASEGEAGKRLIEFLTSAKAAAAIKAAGLEPGPAKK
jgi:molybdate transport system substrate-binding protein